MKKASLHKVIEIWNKIKLKLNWNTLYILKSILSFSNLLYLVVGKVFVVQ